MLLFAPLLLPLYLAMIVVELLLLLTAFILGLIRPKWGLALANWCIESLPSRGWYLGDKTDEIKKKKDHA